MRYQAFVEEQIPDWPRLKAFPTMSSSMLQNGASKKGGRDVHTSRGTTLPGHEMWFVVGGLGPNSHESSRAQ